jgi:hypothetical protein
LDALVELISGRFGRVEPRRRVGAYLRGLLAGLERKNGWTLAEHAGAVSPDGMQRLLRTADWDVDGVRDELRGYVLDQLGDRSGVWIVDDTGFIKKGVRSAGVQRQYTGTSGKIDNCQLGVRPGGQKGGPGNGHSELIPLSSNEIRRLLAALVLTPVACLSSAISWSNWRRRRQHQARTCHYQRRGHRPP